MPHIHKQQKRMKKTGKWNKLSNWYRKWVPKEKTSHHIKKFYNTLVDDRDPILLIEWHRLWTSFARELLFCLNYKRDEDKQKRTQKSKTDTESEIRLMIHWKKVEHIHT